MKIKIKKVTVLTISTFLIMSSVVFALPVSNNIAKNNAISVISLTDKTTHGGKEKCNHKHGHKGAMAATLKEKFKITQAQFDDAKTSGKSIFDLAKVNGFTESQVKTALLEEKYKHVDDAVTKGKIDKVKADSIKSQMKIKIGKWDGKIQNMKSNSSEAAPKQNVPN